LRRAFAIATDRDEVALTSVLERYALKSEDEEKSRAITEDPFSGSYGQSGLAAPLYSAETLIQAMKLNTWHYRCCDTKAHDVAGLGWGLSSTGDGEGSEANREKLKDFFDNCAGSDDETLENILVNALIDYEALGYCFIELVRENYAPEGEPKLLAHLRAHTVRIHKSREKYCQQRGTKKRWFKRYGYERDIDYENGEEYPLGSLAPDKRATEIIFLKNYDPQSDYYGASDVMPALGALLGLQSLTDYNISFFATYGVPSYAIYITGDYDLGDPDENSEYEVVKEIKAHLKTIKDNPHAPLILAIPNTEDGGEVKVEFEKLAVETKDASFRFYRTDMRDEILVAHGVPPYRVGIMTAGTLGGNLGKEATGIYKTSVLAPRKRKLARMINIRIIQKGFGINDWKFRLEDLDDSDEEHDMKIAEFLFGKASMTPNELIRYFGGRFGLSEVEDEDAMNYHYLNGQPIEVGRQTNEELMKSLKQLHDRLVNLAIKDRAAHGVN